ncbi:MAG: hypothetical protein HOJ19_12440 [Candidatus Marinimicrobia bacterium]|nr:hypothetical protein [Candidatus Scalindua sp.]MBT6304123.1 hypothetical protein [Candidatus Neomarinimicrobiota bacterium]
MFFWLLVGFIAWLSCVSLMVLIFAGGNKDRGNGYGYAQILYLQSMANNKDGKIEGKQYRLEQRRNMEVYVG